MKQALTLIMNPSSGGGRSKQLLPDVERRLDALRIPFRVERTRSLEHGVDLAFEAVDNGEIPVVMSGDGLIGAVGGALAGVETKVGLIPAGRGNDLARGLGIPTDPVQAVDCLAAGHTRAIDVGDANGKRFLGIASVGFDSDANRIANEARLLKGQLVYVYAAVRALLAWKPARFSLVENGVQSRLTGYNVVVANNGFYGGGMNVAPDARIDDGQLDVITVGEAGKIRFLLNFPKVFKGTHVEEVESVSFHRTSVIEIGASRPFTIYADGDPLTELPATIRVIPSALQVIVPEPAS
ncbi:MAG TPA: diacylglycerol kinase family lipid kinase [Solirubrobacterales bacterium]|nr:diacylglycerol kinase family lipid kinase [Solirubrobacterales bacterium]HMU26694.1 diacylglycerol kinase family lipid kinase [Solirubrobacterales bacterium]HMX71067.1 diacylglycerol kinase family lipid kinase [Solirubrobacterales bacterium]HMY24711.1 diacylglycerol kinase family lipid kinase [Solirubrobacterales bacterium]HNA23017.1 diacylglycerol kinase family lipid kinase [Solirubrobacterales bacterium]